ncbi:NADPH-dependent assimilatory sulfite reductase hemoprotein subunit [Methylohalobius crimeensis]|uniref:NADPH-dependent assimilatory sulfite reductase hemoprotein subunit n=1 Tax=Methylohalobius crimeensis TaxID=244365 RepID=UPI0003B67DC7|nr:NADPH-dependent assimilatory sulfite reductase hemoprotein subunit [Methylohalobius crimeensis]
MTKRDADLSQPLEKLHPNETFKHDSSHLRGTIAEGLEDRITAGLPSEGDQQLLKFHGTYQEEDRDLRQERRQKRLEPAYEFMLRLRLPGGVCTPEQWLQLDELAHRYGNGTMRLTTRQTFQFHGVLKWHLKPLLQGVDQVRLDSIAACGDVNRNVIANANPFRSEVHRRTWELAQQLSDHLLPKTRAYYEIWLDDQRLAEGPSEPEEEPLYGKTYLPRKFKIALAVPPDNDVDLFAHDLGLIAIEEAGRLLGFNVSVGGGMGNTDGDSETYPRLGEVIGFCLPEQVLKVAETIVAIQRDYGNRKNRARARLKYTLDTHGTDWFVTELEKRLGFRLEPRRPFRFTRRTDPVGWLQGEDGRWHYGLYIDCGRIKGALMEALRTIAQEHSGHISLTCNQNLILTGIEEQDRPRIERLLGEHDLEEQNRITPARQASFACVAMPTCNLAMAEAERYFPRFMERFEELLASVGLKDDEIIVRISGCPNGCARPYLAEIGLTGRAPGKYNLYLGASRAGERLSSLYLENIDEGRIFAALTPLLQRYAGEREPGEAFGDFLARIGWDGTPPAEASTE